MTRSVERNRASDQAVGPDCCEEGVAVRSRLAGYAEKVRVRKTPNGRWHQYRATVRACGTYGWGNTPTEARAKLMERLAEDAADGYRRAAEVLERLRR